MMNGVDVYKSQSAKTLAGGISGVVDLKTIKPLSMKEGFTGNVKLGLSQGERSKRETNSDGSSDTRKPDDDIALFGGYNHDGEFAATVAVFRQNSYNANYQMQMDSQFAFLDKLNGLPHDPLDLDADGDLKNDWYLAPKIMALPVSL